MSQSRRQHRTYLSTPKESAAFNKSYLAAAIAGQSALRESYISSKNIQHFHHGSRHVMLRDEQAEDVDIKTHQVEMTTRFKDLIDGNLKILEESLQELNKGLHSQFARGLYAMLSATCDRTGNTVNYRDKHSNSAALEEMLNKIEFCADENENVRLPEIHLAAGNAEQMLAELESQPKEYHDRIEEIKTRKIEEAVERERRRKARFVCYGT